MYWSINKLYRASYGRDFRVYDFALSIKISNQFPRREFDACWFHVRSYEHFVFRKRKEVVENPIGLNLEKQQKPIYFLLHPISNFLEFLKRGITKLILIYPSRIGIKSMDYGEPGCARLHDIHFPRQWKTAPGGNWTNVLCSAYQFAAPSPTADFPLQINNKIDISFLCKVTLPKIVWAFELPQ